MLTKTVVFGAGGALVGGLYAVMNLVTDTTSTVTLCTTYAHLQHAPELLQVLEVINDEFKEIDHVAAVRAIHAMDKMMGLCLTMKRKDHEPVMADRVAGIVCFRKAKQAIQRFITRAEATNTPRRVIYLQRHTQTLMRYLDRHLQTIVMATRDMYIHP